MIAGQMLSCRLNLNASAKDLVDRGDENLKLLLTVLAWKVQHPDRIFLLRGPSASPETADGAVGRFTLL